MAILDKKTNSLISYYEVLNIAQGASDEEVKSAYARMAHRYHPDHNPQNRRLAELRFKLINTAYQELQTRPKRALYNRKLRVRMADNDNGPTLLGHIANILFPEKSSSKGVQK